MKRIGIIKVSPHAYLYGSCFDTYNRERMKEARGELHIIESSNEPKIPLPDVQIAKVWDYDPKKAEQLAGVFDGDIEVVTDRKDMLKEVDGILIAETSGKGEDHAELAIPCLEAGLPTFVDKPFSNNLPDARRMVDAAEANDTAVMSSSLLRYAKGVMELREEDLGEIQSVVATGPGDLLTYGVHTCEMCQGLIGGGVRSLINVGVENRDIVRLLYEDGRTVIVQVVRDVKSAFEITAYGTKGNASRDTPVPDYRYGMIGVAETFLKMVESRRPIIPHKDLIEVLAILSAAPKSLAEQREVLLSDM